MDPKKLFQEVLIVRMVRAQALQFNSDVPYHAMLEKGRRFEYVTSMEDENDKTLFNDAETGMLWIVPADAVFPLTGRFTRFSDEETTD